MLVINHNEKNVDQSLFNYLSELVEDKLKNNTYNSITICCIGTDRSTGDAYGPLVGTLLKKKIQKNNKVSLIGTLQNPIHAKNLADRVKDIPEDSLVIAVDAALGSNPGEIRIDDKPIRPGIAMGKKIQPIGDISIKAVTNYDAGDMSFAILQNTRLHHSFELAEITVKVINNIIKKYKKDN